MSGVTGCAGTCTTINSWRSETHMHWQPWYALWTPRRYGNWLRCRCYFSQLWRHINLLKREGKIMMIDVLLTIVCRSGQYANNWPWISWCWMWARSFSLCQQPNARTYWLLWWGLEQKKVQEIQRQQRETTRITVGFRATLHALPISVYLPFSVRTAEQHHDQHQHNRHNERHYEWMNESTVLRVRG